MKTIFIHRLPIVMIALMATAGLTACSTTATRIRANPELFAQLTPDQQALVKNGRVGLGFSMDAVKLALGDPDRVTTTENNDGVMTVWHYASYEADGHALYTGYYHAGPRWWGGPPPFYYLDYPNRYVRDRFRVTFHGDRVSAITAESAT